MADAPAVKKPAEKKKKTFAAYKEGKKCPKCQSRMAMHKDRYTCGKCKYTEFIKQEAKK